MISPHRPDADPRLESTPGKVVWTRPTLDVMDVVAATQAGSDVRADTDPNEPS